MSDKTIIYTDGGSSNIRGRWYGGWGFHGTAPTGATFGGYGGCKVARATNNVAEMEAYIRAGEYALKHKYMDVVFKLDSKYVLVGANKFLSHWEKNGWVTRAGKPVQNKKLWLQIKRMRNDLNEKGIKHNYEWVKGHSGVPGNELADKGATKGKRKAVAGDFKPVFYTDTEEVQAKVKKFKADFPKSLCLGRLLAITNESLPYREESEQHVYFQTNFDDKDNVRSKYLGKTGVDVLEGVTFSKKKIDVLQNIMAALNKEVKHGARVPCVFQWDKISSKKKYAELAIKGKEALVAIEGDIQLNGEDLLAYPVLTPLISFSALESMDDKYSLLDNYVSGKYPDSKIFDITDSFLIEDKKGKQKLNPEIRSTTGFKEVLSLENKTCEVLLVPTVNMPALIKLGTIAKESGGLKMKIILHAVTNLSFRHSLILECGDGDVSIFDCPYSNIRLYKKK